MQDEVNEKTMALCIKGGNLGAASESSTDKAAFRDREEKTAVEEDGRAEPM